MSRRVVRLVFAVAAIAGLLAAPMAMAQDDDSGGGDDAGDNSAVQATAIGCVATYDLVLARGLAGTHIAAVQKARTEAREVYKQAAGLDDDKVDDDIAQADSHMPAFLVHGNASLEQYRHICDALLSGDDDDDSDLPPALTT